MDWTVDNRGHWRFTFNNVQIIVFTIKNRWYMMIGPTIIGSWSRSWEARERIGK